MPTTTADNNSILIALLQHSEKARRGGGGGKGPGSRGGHFFRDAKGNIRYGDQPHQVLPRASKPTVGARSTNSARVAANRARAVATGRGGGSGKPRVGELRAGYRIKPQTAAGKRSQHHKMLAEMDRAIKTGKDPHGNKLSAANVEKLRFLATSLRTDLKGTSKKEESEKANQVKHPGSRGGFPWLDDKGNIHYGARPGSNKPGSDSLNNGTTNPKAQNQQQIMGAISRAISTGMDSHGKPLAPATLQKLKGIIAKLKTGLGGTAKKETESNLPFSAYKDVNGQWRWLVRSSSAFTDRDGETVSLKALEKATQKLSEKGEQGDLTVFDWWHTPVVIGKCDFSAVHGKVLIESGIFTNPIVGERISTAIANKEFTPGVSLTFAHREPGPAVLPGRIFEEIEILGRSLLPADSASNVATTVEIINLAANPGQTTKEVIPKMDAVKEEKLKKLIGPEVFAAFINGSELAEKSLEMAGLSYKAVLPAPAESAPVPVEVAPIAAPAPVAVEPPVVISGLPAAQAALEDRMNQIQQELREERGEVEVEEPGEEVNADDAFEYLSDSVADKVLAKLTAAQAIPAATASKEVSDALGANTIAMKEVAFALATVQAENTSLKARLDALEGIQPAAVRQRASQGGGVPLEQLPQGMQGIINSEKENKDPYAKIIADLGLSMSPRG